jgi:molecular chaperone GrpE
MIPNRNPRHPGVAPGEPEAPVAAPQAAPAPPAPDRAAGRAATEDGQRVQEARDGQAVPKTEGGQTPGAELDHTPEGGLDQTPEGGVDQTPEGGLERTPEEQGAPALEDEGVSAPEPDEVAAKAEKADQYLELAQRTKADFENYRKRASRETAAAQERGVAKLARELLPAVDNLDRALAHVEGDSDNGAGALISAIKLVHADVIAALARVGIERFSPEGERFDPQRHEAIAQQPVEGAQPGTIVEVYQRGYALGDFVIRPARVVVAG